MPRVTGSFAQKVDLIWNEPASTGNADALARYDGYRTPTNRGSERAKGQPSGERRLFSCARQNKQSL